MQSNDSQSTLPHQEDEVRPEEIPEIVQSAPEILISAGDHAHLPDNRKAIPPSLLNTDQNLAQKIKNAPASINKMYSDINNAKTELILKEARKNNHLTLKGACELCGLNTKETKAIIKNLVRENKLIARGRWGHKFYQPLA